MTKESFKKKTKLTTKKTEERRKENQEFIGLATDLKEIVVDLNQRVSEVEALVDRIRQRMGL